MDPGYTCEETTAPPKSTCALIPTADLSITGSFAPNPVYDLYDTVLTVTVSNSGPNATEFEATIDFPVDLLPDTDDPDFFPVGFCEVTNPPVGDDYISCLGESLAVGASKVYTFTFTAFAGETDIEAEANLLVDGTLLDPNETNNSPPSVSITIKPIECGDGLVHTGEECDDAGVAPGDGCSDQCEVETGFACANPAGQASECSCDTALEYQVSPFDPDACVQLDYGDSGIDGAAPTDPARHVAGPLRLGTLWSPELQAGALDGDDDDGIDPTEVGALVFAQGVPEAFDVQIGGSGPGQLAVWVDWDEDLDFGDETPTVLTTSWAARPDRSP